LNILVSRYERTANGKGTIGKLSVDGSEKCFTLEDVVRPPEAPKVYGETAIPEGDYIVTMRWSEHFKRDMPHVENVPGFEGILIHYGNSDLDTEGCILVGTTHEPADDFIGFSRLAFARISGLIDGAIKGGEAVKVSVKNNF
jgi:Steigviridae/Suoliviridae L,D-carboxypeptidase/transpeptidase